MEDRKVVSAQELLEILNRRLRDNPATSQCEVLGAVKKRDVPYDDGGNWNRSIAVKGSPVDPQKAGEEAAVIVEAVAEEFNVL